MSESQAQRVRDFVTALERDDRYIVLLYYADGLTPMEISRVLDLPSTKVRTRLETLRHQLDRVASAAPRRATRPNTAHASQSVSAYA
jgi:DNA-directed RNA polymerase specialized sigma24 family protein